MFTRSTLVFLLSACALGASCGDSPSFPEAGSAVIAGEGVLSVLSGESIVVAPRGAAQIRVLYRPADNDRDREGDFVSGVAVEFALVGEAAGVSLSNAEALTDEDGVAVAQLTAGSDSANFQVRARAMNTEPVYVDVQVLKSAEREAMVSARYSGLRALTSRSVSAVAGVGCQAARMLVGSETKDTQTYEDPDASVTFNLGPGLHYAILAWARDDKGSILADGCSELDVPVLPRAESADAPDGEFAGVVVDLRDRAFSLVGRYTVTLELDVARSAQRAGETAVAGGQALLTSPTTPGADYFLDAIEAGMRSAGKVEAAATLRDARSAGTLDIELQAELTAANVGPQPWLSKLGYELQDRGSRLKLTALYGVTSIAGVPMSLQLTGMQSRSADASRSLGYPTALLPMAVIDAQYDDARAVIAVDTIRVQLPLGSYAGRLLDAIDASEQAGLVGLLESRSGCSQLVAWSAMRTVIDDACKAYCVQAACAGAIDTLLGGARTKLSTLDVDHPSIGVRGELRVFDRNNDSIVDELGAAAFQGSWGKAPKAEQADSVDADFSVVLSGM